MSFSRLFSTNTEFDCSQDDSILLLNSGYFSYIQKVILDSFSNQEISSAGTVLFSKSNISTAMFF